MMNELPDFDKTRIDDVMVGNAMPEAEQGLNVARLIFNGIKSRGCSWSNCKNRYCASGLRNDWYGYSKIQSGMAHCIVAGGAESMSLFRWEGTNNSVMLLQKQETKITTGEWV
jgi:acetyl-CoA acyltransferase